MFWSILVVIIAEADIPWYARTLLLLAAAYPTYRAVRAILSDKRIYLLVGTRHPERGSP